MNPIQVLVVEDQAGEIRLMKQALEREAVPISVHVAVDAEQATRLLMQGGFKPDVVIVDLNFPRLSGLQFLERCHPSAPVVVFTTSANMQDHRRALELGAKEYIQKPSDLTDYTEVVSLIVLKWTSCGGIRQ